MTFFNQAAPSLCLLQHLVIIKQLFSNNFFNIFQVELFTIFDSKHKRIDNNFFNIFDTTMFYHAHKNNFALTWSRLTMCKKVENFERIIDFCYSEKVVNFLLWLWSLELLKKIDTIEQLICEASLWCAYIVFSFIFSCYFGWQSLFSSLQLFQTSLGSE